MTTGYQFAGRCFTSLASAEDAYYSAQSAVLIPGPVSYVTQYSKHSGAWSLAAYQIDQAGTQTLRYESLVPPLSLAECNPAEAFLDGHALGWSVAGVMIVAWGLRKLRDQVK